MYQMREAIPKESANLMFRQAFDLWSNSQLVGLDVNQDKLRGRRFWESYGFAEHLEPHGENARLVTLRDSLVSALGAEG